MRPWRRTLAFHTEGDKPASHSFCFLALQPFATRETRFRQINKKTEPGLERIVFGRKIGAVERITHLETQGIARAEPAGTNS